ncbi:ABC transporter B family member 29, chloroplastic-like [Zingiber officinale]|uniref:ABC transporter B family member 29, chloroplastic-like n=1 Tax=Zingiber officinale TaxID=94328 RepID=UPI001C4CEB75|nr:ABC transporter B family member 29, chloroplastic-like [Zingiber officinale]
MLLLAALAPPSSVLSLSSSSLQNISFLRNRLSVAHLRFSSLIILSNPSLSSSSSPFFAAARESPPSIVAACESRPRDAAFRFSSPLFQIAPFLRDEWTTILKGWLCSFVAIYCLSRAVPQLGRLSSILSQVHSPRVPQEGAVLVALGCLSSAAAYLQQAFLWEAASRSVYRLRIHVFDRILQRDLEFFEGNNGLLAGDVAYRMTAEAADVSEALYAILNMTVPNTLQFVAMATQMISVSPMLSLLAAFAVPCILFFIAYLGETLRKISRKASMSSARLSAYLNEVLPSMLVVKANIGESKESFRFQTLALDNLLQQLKKKKMKALIPQLVQALCLGGLLVLCVCSVVVSRNSFDCSNLFSFITALMLLIEPIKGAGKAYNELKQGEPAIERLLDPTRFIPKVTEKSDAIDLDYVTGDIRFCGVKFRYGDDMPYVLDQADLHIRPGERVALVGPSGGGKTTLSKLLLRLYDPQCGSILVDNHDIQDVKLKSLRKHIVLVSQESMLFSGTVTENIGYRDLTGQINQADVEYAARIANADEFITKFVEGYETNIGQRGSLLSGGQKQRLAIARALYQNASLLILDEATSALDGKSELLVREALKRLMENHTVLVIAHRLETVQMADRVVVLDRGKLTEISKSSFLSSGGLCDSHLV